MSRPTRAAGALEALEAAIPARVLKRVRDNPALAEAWAWSDTGVQHEDTTVTFGADPVTQDSIRCTCLMAPKCVHVLAVVTALVEGASAAPLVEPVVVSPVDPAVGAALPVAEDALARLLRAGAHSADLVVRADLSRAAHEARALGLHRLGRSITRLVRSLRLYESGHPTFALAALVAEAEEALLVARQLGRSATPEWIGAARRRYAPVGTLRLWGVCSEVVVSPIGAGVITWLADQRGRCWQVPDVRPRPPGQALGVYDVAPPLTMSSHRALSREGLFVQDATASDDARLGAGEGVSAVRSAGATWGEAPLDALWGGERGPLRFFRGVVSGLWRDALVIDAPDGDIFVLPGSEHASLPWRENLKLLARLPGAELSVVGRDVPDRHRTVIGLAAASSRLDLPPAWRERVNLGLDRLTTSHLLRAADAPVWIRGDVHDRPDPLAALRRRVARALLAGVESLPPECWGAVAAESARLRQAMLPGAAELLEHLPVSAKHGDFVAAWLAAARYLSVVDAARARGSWVVSPT